VSRSVGLTIDPSHILQQVWRGKRRTDLRRAPGTALPCMRFEIWRVLPHATGITSAVDTVAKRQQSKTAPVEHWLEVNVSLGSTTVLSRPLRHVKVLTCLSRYQRHASGRLGDHILFECQSQHYNLRGYFHWFSYASPRPCGETHSEFQSKT